MAMPSTSIRRALAAATPFALGLALAPGLQGCSAIGPGTITAGAPPYTVGSGVQTTERRAVGSYHAIAVSTGVTVLVHRGEAGSASVTADDNLVDQVTTDVRDGMLYVGIAGGVRTAGNLKVEIANSALDSISASSGSTVDAESLSGATLDVSASTGATVRGAGSAESLTLSASSGATADLRNVEVQSADVTVSTGATAHVHPTASVTGTCTVGATLLIRGHPARDDVSTDATATTKEGQ